MPEQALLHWDAESLWERLEPELPGLSVEVVHSTLSTNSALLERARAVPDPRGIHGDTRVHRSVESAAFGRRAVDLQPCLYVAEHQSAGRGRVGRVWHSEVGASLTFSLSLLLHAPDWSGLSLAVGVALAEALAEPNDLVPRVAIKWPNDLWFADAPIGPGFAGRKLGGILIETVAAGTQRLAIIGIGLNVLPFDANQTHTGFASLRELDPSASAPQVLARVALPLVQALKRFEQGGFAAFADRYTARDLLRGHTVHTTVPELPEGVACGVSPHGALLVRTPAGEVVPVSSGEVSVRLAPPA